MTEYFIRKQWKDFLVDIGVFSEVPYNSIPRGGFSQSYVRSDLELAIKCIQSLFVDHISATNESQPTKKDNRFKLLDPAFIDDDKELLQLYDKIDEEWDDAWFGTIKPIAIVEDVNVIADFYLHFRWGHNWDHSERFVWHSRSTPIEKGRLHSPKIVRLPYNKDVLSLCSDENVHVPIIPMYIAMLVMFLRCIFLNPNQQFIKVAECFYLLEARESCRTYLRLHDWFNYVKHRQDKLNELREFFGIDVPGIRGKMNRMCCAYDPPSDFCHERSEDHSSLCYRHHITKQWQSADARPIIARDRPTQGIFSSDDNIQKWHWIKEFMVDIGVDLEYPPITDQRITLCSFTEEIRQQYKNLNAVYRGCIYYPKRIKNSGKRGEQLEPYFACVDKRERNQKGIAEKIVVDFEYEVTCALGVEKMHSTEWNQLVDTLLTDHNKYNFEKSYERAMEDEDLESYITDAKRNDIMNGVVVLPVDLMWPDPSRKMGHHLGLLVIDTKKKEQWFFDPAGYTKKHKNFQSWFTEKPLISGYTCHVVEHGRIQHLFEPNTNDRPEGLHIADDGVCAVICLLVTVAIYRFRAAHGRHVEDIVSDLFEWATRVKDRQNIDRPIFGMEATRYRLLKWQHMMTFGSTDELSECCGIISTGPRATSSRSCGVYISMDNNERCLRAAYPGHVHCEEHVADFMRCRNKKRKHN